MVAKQKRLDLRLEIKEVRDDGLYERLAELDSKDRVAEIRHLARLGIMFKRGGLAAPAAAPAYAPAETAKPKAENPDEISEQAKGVGASFFG